MDLTNFKEKVAIKEQTSSMDDWQKEARKLEQQGKQEQADIIRETILHIQEVPWEVQTYENLENLVANALDPNRFNKKAKDLLFRYSLIYNEPCYHKQLVNLKYKPAQNPKAELPKALRRVLNEYSTDDPKYVKLNTAKYGADYRNEFNQTPLMLATQKGSPQIIKYLLGIGANKDTMDNYGRNPFQIALENAVLNKKYCIDIIPKVFNLVQPNFIKIKIGDSMIKFHNKQMEFFMLSFMIAKTRLIFFEKKQYGPFGFQSADFVEISESFPSFIMADYRKKRPYISSFLSKHEHQSSNDYNKKLFVRTSRGFYILNPILEMEVDGVWRNYYKEILHVDTFAAYAPHYIDLISYIEDFAKKIKESALV